MLLHHAKILFLGLGFATLTAGCYSLPAATSGQIGCAEKDITIADEEQNFGSKTWTATCEGKTYYCSAVGGGQYAPPQKSSRSGCQSRTPSRGSSSSRCSQRARSG